MLFYVVSADEIPERRFATIHEASSSGMGDDELPIFVTSFWGTHPEFADEPWFVTQRSTLIGKRSSTNLAGALREARRLPPAESAKAVVVRFN